MQGRAWKGSFSGSGEVRKKSRALGSDARRVGAKRVAAAGKRSGRAVEIGLLQVVDRDALIERASKPMVGVNGSGQTADAAFDPTKIEANSAGCSARNAFRISARRPGFCAHWIKPNESLRPSVFLLQGKETAGFEMRRETEDTRHGPELHSGGERDVTASREWRDRIFYRRDYEAQFGRQTRIRKSNATSCGPSRVGRAGSRIREAREDPFPVGDVHRALHSTSMTNLI